MATLLLTALFYLFVCLITALAICCIVFLFYLYYIHKVNEHLPGPPRSSFILGNLPDIRHYEKTGRTVLDYQLEMQAKYGPITVMFILHRAIVYISDPLYISEILGDFNRGYKSSFFNKKLSYVFGQRNSGTSLLTNLDDESWRRRRNIMNPAFHRKCLKTFMKDFNEVCDRFMTRMKNIVGQETSMMKEFANLTLDVISQVSFNVKLGAIEDPNCPFAVAIARTLRGVEANIKSPLPASLLSIFQFRLFQTATIKEQIDAVKFLRKFAFDCIIKRIDDIKAGKMVPDDLLSMLVNAQSLSMEDMIDEFGLIFKAGHETTSNTLSFALYEIARNPQIEEKILNEVNEVIGNRKNVEFEDLPKLKYVGQVFQESLRKYPVAGGPLRYLRKEVVVGGYRIPKVSLVSLQKYLVSHNPKVWSNPEVFNPDRFAEPEKIPHFNATYYPFGVGPRNCLGQTFAKFEAKVVLARLLHKYHFELLPGQTNAMVRALTWKPRDNVMCKVVPRQELE